MPTEKTPLTGPGTSFGSTPAVPFYVQDTHRFYSRRRRERQLQCIMFVTIIATFIMALVVTISYSVRSQDEPPAVNLSLSEPGEALRPDELAEALRAGEEAIAARRLADARARAPVAASAERRLQAALGTGARARQIALAGVAELAATRSLEKSRSLAGRPPSLGSPLDGGWPGEACLARACPGTTRFRSLDGTCNREGQWGAAFRAYRRALPPDYADGIGAPRRARSGGPLPSARQVSRLVHPPSPSSNPAFTVMLAVFGQFLDHDITATAVSQGANGSALACCPPEHPECFPVEVTPGDPLYQAQPDQPACMPFVRSAPAAQCKTGPRQQLNQVTAFIDGSAIYGSDAETAEGLREWAGGRLRMQMSPDNRSLLPASLRPEDGCNREAEVARGRYCFATGDARANENLHLTTMHLLWARQHNLLAEKLAAVNPQWDDERLYQEARRLVGAQLQHVAYREFLPLVLGEAEVSRRGLRPLANGWRGFGPEAPDPTVANHFAAAAFRFAHTLLPGLMRLTDAQEGSESYVQLHRMLFNPYSLYSQAGEESSIRSATSNAIQKTSTHVSSQLTEHLFEDPLTNQTTPACGLDLVSLNIQRGRDHGLPGYVEWRRYCALPVPSGFDDLRLHMDPDALDAISKLYESVDDLDLYTGALAEINRGDGLLGPTFTCLIADQFQRLQSGDSYWYENSDQPGTFNQDQLREIRKTTLARIICDTSDGITEVQPEVMRSIGPDNPMTSCEDIPQLSLEAWKTQVPVLTMAEVVVPTVDWLNFKNEVNSTILDIVASITAKKPPIGSLPEDWLAFQKDVNATFTDLRNKFSALHPKVMPTVSLTRNLTAAPGVFDWMGLKDDVTKTVSDIMDSIVANKPPVGSLPADWLAYRKKINDSLLDIKKKFKVIHPKPTLTKTTADTVKLVGEIPTIDWLAIRNEINATIMDVVQSINSTKPIPGSTPADWLAFRKKVNDSLIGIKNKFAGLHPKPTTPVEKVPKDDAGTAFDWMSLKDDVTKTVSDIMDSIVANKPPVGSLPADWLAYRKKINDSLLDIKKKFKVIHPKPILTKTTADTVKLVGEIPTIDWLAIRDEINATIMDVVQSINSTKPLPGSLPADWLAFRKKVNDSLIGIKNKFAGLHPKPITPVEKLSKGDDDPAFDWIQFKGLLNKTLNDIISSTASKKPPPGSTPEDWLAFQQQMNKTFAEFVNQFSGLHPKELDIADELHDSPEPAADKVDGTDANSNVNKTVAEIIAEINANKPPPGSSQEDWLAFQQKMNDAFAGMQNKYAAQYQKNKTKGKLKLGKAADGATIDMMALKDDLNKSLTNLVDLIKSKKPPVNSSMADWLAYKKEVKASVSQLKKDISQFKVKDTTEMEYTEFATKNGSIFDWIGWTKQINNTINGLIVDIQTIPPGDPKWASFRDYLNSTFGSLKDKFATIRPIPTQVKLMSMMKDDWFSFKDQVNSTIEDTLNDIILHQPTPSDPSSLSYSTVVKSRIAEMRENLKAMKTEWLDKVTAATDKMIVTNTRLAASGSAAVIDKTFVKVNLCLMMILSYVHIAI